jgi:hypothetical protein
MANRKQNGGNGRVRRARRRRDSAAVAVTAAAEHVQRAETTGELLASLLALNELLARCIRALAEAK